MLSLLVWVCQLQSYLCSRLHELHSSQDDLQLTLYQVEVAHGHKMDCRCVGRFEMQFQ